MSSQSGNSHDPAAYSGHPSSFIVGSNAEPESLSRTEFEPQHPPPASDMGLRFMTSPVSDDAQFGPEPGTSQNAVYSNELNLPASGSSNIHFSPFPHGFHTGLNLPIAYPNSGSSYFSPNSQNNYTLGYGPPLDNRPILDSYSTTSTMAPPSRSPNLQHLNSPATTRDLYTGHTPQLRRASDLLSRSPSASSNMRNAPVSPSSSSGFASPANMENPNSGPPLQTTEQVCTLQTSDGQPVRAEILGKVDKGFFMADNDWTCYRRNYFQLSCSYTLHPMAPTNSIRVFHNGSSHSVQAFAMSIAAVVDGRDGRAIDLVQHTPKRDKGPQVKPERVPLLARPHPSVQGYGAGPGDGLGPSSRSLYDQNYGPNSSQNPTEYTYERIQFKCATANNGRRRAAQQYYHLMVELCVDLGLSAGESRWVKIAHRISAPVVVRGRSPGHYHSERRHSNASAGGSAGPNGGAGSYDSNNGVQRGSTNQLNIPGPTSMVQGGYADTYESRPHHYSRANVEVPMEPIMSAEEIRAIDESEGYLYYPSPLFEGTEISLPHIRPHANTLAPRDDRSVVYQLPNLGPKIKQEPGGYSGYSLPSLTAGTPADSIARHFGRFEGLPSSRGFYPTVFTQAQLGSL